MRLERKLPLKDAWAIWFVLGVVMLNYPFLHIFDKSILILGIPLPILYFFIGWPFSIFIIYLFSIYMGHDSVQRPPDYDQHNKSRGGQE
jgi:predicted Kef-type K+ transport protein